MASATTCRVTVMDTSDPSITFDDAGVCHYVHQARRRLETECFRGADGEARLEALVREIKREGRGKPYDCAAGISGGADSSFTLVRARELGLRPLAVHLDNGWNSEVAVGNIERLLRRLDLDLHTHVVNWEEIKDLQRAFFRASMANVEVVSDHAITAIVYQQAAAHDVRFILSGSNVETESIMPDAWGYDPRDARHVFGIHRAFGQLRRLTSYPFLPAGRFLYNIFIRRVKHIPLLNYGGYRKADAIERLRREFDWVPYARKHGESRFTRFFQEYYLPEKFGYDKRRAHFSSLIVSGQMTREEAFAELAKPLYEPQERELEVEYVTKKLEFSRAEWAAIMRAPERSYREFPNNSWMFDHSRPLTQFVRRVAKGERRQPTSRQAAAPAPRPAVASTGPGPVVHHLAFASFRNESRALRSASSALESAGAARVVFVGYAEAGAPAREDTMPGCHTIRLRRPPFRGLPRIAARSIQWAFWTIQAVTTLRREHTDLLQCHSLAALPASVLVKILNRVPLIYDAHELETERVGWGSVQKWAARVLERRLITYSDHVFVVSSLIEQWYRDHYGIDAISLLRNVPRKPAGSFVQNRLLRNALGISDNVLLFIYLGAIGEGRGFRQIIEAFAGLGNDRHVVFMGGGPEDRAVLEVVEASRRYGNVHWHPPVPNAQVIEYASGADVGISLIEDICLSYRYCLPNKVHECRLAGLPVIVSDLPEMARFVADSGCGWAVRPTADDLRALVSTIDRAEIATVVSRVRQAPLTWDDEQRIYLNVFSRLLRDSQAIAEVTPV